MKKHNTPASRRFRIVLFAFITVLFTTGFPASNYRTFTNDTDIKSLVGVWNGFNDHMVVLECLNHLETAVDISLTVKDQGNSLRGTEEVRIPPYGTHHALISRFNIRDSYGTLYVELKNGDSIKNKVSCNTMTYRLSGHDGLEYATSTPLEEGTTGSSSGVFNSMNPDTTIDAPVYNWLTIFNPGDTPLSVFIRIRNQDGTPISEKDISVVDLAPGARQDFALGHPDGQTVGLYEIIPLNSSQTYGAFLSRYSEVDTGEFNFSMFIPSSSGYQDSGIVPASTMGPSINWAEVANVSSETTQLSIEVFDRSGAELGVINNELAPYSQQHVYLNQFLGSNNVGFFRVRSDRSVIVQSTNYGHEAQNPRRIRWAFNTMGGASVSKELFFPVNTNLNAANWLKLFVNPHQASTNEQKKDVAVTLTLYDKSGQIIDLEGNARQTIDGSLDFPVHEFVDDHFIGVVRARVEDDEDLIQGQLVRVALDQSSVNVLTMIPVSPFSVSTSSEDVARLKPENFKLIGGWRVEQPFTRGALAIDFENGYVYAGGHSQQDNIRQYELSTMGEGESVSEWPILKFVKTIPKFWDSKHVGGLHVDGDMLWVSTRTHYDTSPRNIRLYGKNLKTEVVEEIPVPLKRPMFGGGFVKGHPSEIFLGCGGYESGQGSAAGPTLARVNGEILINQANHGSMTFGSRELRPATYWPWDYQDSWVALMPRDGVGQWACDRIYSGGIWHPGGVLYWAVMGVGDLRYSRQNETFAAQTKNYLYSYDPYSFDNVEYDEWSHGVVHGHEVDEQGRIYLLIRNAWKSGLYTVDSAIKVFEIVQ